LTYGRGPGAALKVEHGLYVLIKDARRFSIKEIDDRIYFLETADEEDLDIHPELIPEEIERLTAEKNLPKTFQNTQLTPGRLIITVVKQNS